MDEPILADDYPVYAGYFYIADGEVVQSPATGTVAELKEEIGAREIRRCSMNRFTAQRSLAHPT